MNQSKGPVLSNARPFNLHGDAVRYSPSYKELLITFLVAAAVTLGFFLTVHSCR